MFISDDELLARTRKVLGARPAAPPIEARAESSLRDLGLDSLDALGLMFDLETEFAVTLPESETARIATFGDLLQSLRSAVGAAAPDALASTPRSVEA